MYKIRTNRHIMEAKKEEEKLSDNIVSNEKNEFFQEKEVNKSENKTPSKKGYLSNSRVYSAKDNKTQIKNNTASNFNSDIKKSTGPLSPKNNMYLSRVEEQEKIRKERRERLIEKTKAEESKKYTDRPTIEPMNKKKYIQSSKSFLERLEDQTKTMREKKKQLIDKINEKRKKEEEEIFKRVNELNKRKLTKEEWEKQLEKMREKELKKKKKFKQIEERTLAQRMKECKFKPEIDTGSEELLKKTLGNHNRINTSTIIKRLYNEDLEKRKEKKELLDERYLPTFTPNIQHSLKSHNWSGKKSFNSSTGKEKKIIEHKKIKIKDHYRTDSTGVEKNKLSVDPKK